MINNGLVAIVSSTSLTCSQYSKKLVDSKKNRKIKIQKKEFDTKEAI